jgi:hypothetical protein
MRCARCGYPIEPKQESVIQASLGYHLCCYCFQKALAQAGLSEAGLANGSPSYRA